MNLDVFRHAPSRAQLVRFEEALKAYPPADIETIHTFGPGFYARTIKVKAGIYLSGMVHATAHIFMVSEGDITVVTEEGMKRVGAGYQAVCRSGLKRAGFTHADTVCTNVHITNETDLVKLQAALIEPEGLIEHEGAPCLG
ncbi:MAG: hypothetical protein ABI433_07200 [Burkholderiaceae bacterium]